MSAPTVRRTTARVIPVNARGEAPLTLSRDPFDRAEVTFPYDGAVVGLVRAAVAHVGMRS